MNPNLASQRISVFLSVDRHSLNEYFNPHDPAPVYKRQLRFDFVQYLNDSVAAYRRHSQIVYKLTYKAEDFAIVEPFMYAVRQHFQAKAEVRRREFSRFKKGSYKLLFLSLGMLLVCRGLLMLVVSESENLVTSLSHGLEVFSWVVLWRPIDKLIFQWNPFLKEISLLHKMATAEVVEIEAETEEVNVSLPSNTLIQDLLRA